MRNLVFDLPEEVQWNIKKFSKHPVAELFQIGYRRELDSCNSDPRYIFHRVVAISKIDRYIAQFKHIDLDDF